MEIDKEELRNKILINVMPLIGSIGVSLVVAAASKALTKLTATNVENSTMAGTASNAPADQNFAANRSNVSGYEVDGNVASDSATGNAARIDGASSGAQGQSNNMAASLAATDAVETGAGAVHTNNAAMNLA
jgi:hypothetical protein